MKTGAAGLSKFSFGAKNSSLAKSTAPPRRSEARSTSSVKSINFSHKKAQKAQRGKVSSCDPTKNVLLDLKLLRAEIDQKSVLNPRSAKVAQQLRNMFINQTATCLNFN